MSDPTTPESPSAGAPKGLASRAIGVLLSPRATYQEVAARPRWAGALGLVLLVAVAATLVFFSTDVGRQALLDQQIRSMESFGKPVTDAQYAQLQRMAPYSGYFGAAGQFVFLPLIALIVSGLAFAVFNAALGCDAAFKQVFAVVVHSGFVVALQQLFVLPLDYARQSLSSPTNLSVFLPMLDENSFPARMLGSIDLFVIWWAVSLAIGLGVLYRRRTGPIASTLLIVYAVVAVVIAAVKTALSGA